MLSEDLEFGLNDAGPAGAGVLNRRRPSNERRTITPPTPRPVWSQLKTNVNAKHQQKEQYSFFCRIHKMKK